MPGTLLEEGNDRRVHKISVYTSGRILARRSSEGPAALNICREIVHFVVEDRNGLLLVRQSADILWCVADFALFVVPLEHYHLFEKPVGPRVVGEMPKVVVLPVCI